MTKTTLKEKLTFQKIAHFFFFILGRLKRVAANPYKLMRLRIPDTFQFANFSATEDSFPQFDLKYTPPSTSEKIFKVKKIL